MRLRPLFPILTLTISGISAQGQDLYIKKNVSVGGNFVSTTETTIKGARIRDVNQTPAGSTVTLRQCDLKRTVTLNEQAQTYYVAKDPQDAAAARAAALATGAPVPETTTGGGKIDVTTTITDTDERNQMFGYPARHLKTKVTQESSQNACSPVHQNFDIDGWYADVGKEVAGCTQVAPPVQQGQRCQDAIVEHHSGSGKGGYPLSQNITMPSPDGMSMTVTITVSELSKQSLEPALFDIRLDTSRLTLWQSSMGCLRCPRRQQEPRELPQSRLLQAERCPTTARMGRRLPMRTGRWASR
jgi:hypothetical protein